jgi:hypothetical protein
MKTTKTMKTGGAKPKAMYGKEIMQKGGSTGKTKKYKTKNSYSELTGSGDEPLRTTVNSPDGNYKKNIEWQYNLARGKKPYQMSVTKGGKTNQFQLSEEQANSQRKKVKKTMGFQKGGTVKPVIKKPVPKKPTPKKVVPASPSNMKTFRLMNGYDSKGVKVESMKKGGIKK